MSQSPYVPGTLRLTANREKQEASNHLWTSAAVRSSLGGHRRYDRGVARAYDPAAPSAATARMTAASPETCEAPSRSAATTGSPAPGSGDGKGRWREPAAFVFTSC